MEKNRHRDGQVLVTILFDGFDAACLELTQPNGTFSVGDGVQGRDASAAGTGVYLPGTVLATHANGAYDVQWESGGPPVTLGAASLRRIDHAAAGGSPRAVSDLLRYESLTEI